MGDGKVVEFGVGQNAGGAAGWAARGAVKGGQTVAAEGGHGGRIYESGREAERGFWRVS